MKQNVFFVQPNRTEPPPSLFLKLLARTLDSRYLAFLPELLSNDTRVNSIIWPTIHPNTTLSIPSPPRTPISPKGRTITKKLGSGRSLPTQSHIHLSHSHTESLPLSLSRSPDETQRPFRVVVFLSIYGNLYVLDNLRKLFTPRGVTHSQFLAISLSPTCS